MRSAFGLALHGNVGACKGCRPDTNAGCSSSIALASGVWRASIGNLSPHALQSVPLQRHTLCMRRSENVAVPPNDSDAIVGSLPRNVRPSVCQAMLSFPSKYKRTRTALYGTFPVTRWTDAIISISTGGMSVKGLIPGTPPKKLMNGRNIVLVIFGWCGVRVQLRATRTAPVALCPRARRENSIHDTLSSKGFRTYFRSARFCTSHGTTAVP